MDWKKELRDQTVHMIAGAVTIVPVVSLGVNPLTCGWATFCCGLIREVGEEGNPVTWDKIKYAATSFPDLIFWAGIGIVIGLFA